MKVNRKERSIIKEYSDRIKVLSNPDLGMRENLLNLYKNSCPDASEEEAGEAVDHILCGILDFNEGVSAFVQNGTEAVLDVIERQTGEKSNEERYTTYCNITVAIKTMDQKVFSELMGSEKFHMEEALENLFYSHMECGGNVTEEMVEEAKQMMISALESSVISLNDIEGLKNIPEDMAEEYIREFAVEEWSLEERKAYLSLAAYLAYRDGKIFADVDEAQAAVSPYYWAVSIAADLEAEKAVHNALKGNTTWENAMKVIKAVGCIALSLALCIVDTGLLLLTLGLMFTTASVFSFFAIGLLGYGLMFGFIYLELLLEDGYTASCEFVKKYVEDNYEKIQDGIQNVCQFIKNKVMAGYLIVTGRTSSSISMKPQAGTK
ncbi:hypothetical protein GPL15_23295 [Clostridium sp. MCC353]|uniref:hypothetical protein n=1 Tax=Clostridium sp. MCC353 TaxID=2592646 RepID=UPI001C00BA5F|nr:hypothetical protein [Clostridium sp. MCC353]MBT9779407.1 hypothetical protein [Clostridium sp. MCC353]